MTSIGHALVGGQGHPADLPTVSRNRKSSSKQGLRGPLLRDNISAVKSWGQSFHSKSTLSIGSRSVVEMKQLQVGCPGYGGTSISSASPTPSRNFNIDIFCRLVFCLFHLCPYLTPITARPDLVTFDWKPGERLLTSSNLPNGGRRIQS